MSVAKDPAATESNAPPESTFSRSTTLTVETEYVGMLLELHSIHWIYNFAASFANWMLLAGYLVIPGTFTSLQKSDSIADKLSQNRAEKAILETIQNPPLVAISWSLLGIGISIMSVLSYRWRHNYLWLINRLFIPAFLNTAAGLLTSLINIYTAKDGYWSVMALLAVIVSGVLAVSSTGLTVFYKFWKLRIVMKDHDRETRAGMCNVSPQDLQGQLAARTS